MLRLNASVGGASGGIGIPAWTHRRTTKELLWKRIRHLPPPTPPHNLRKRQRHRQRHRQNPLKLKYSGKTGPHAALSRTVHVRSGRPAHVPGGTAHLSGDREHRDNRAPWRAPKQLPTAAAPPGRGTWPRRFAISSAPRPAARSCCWRRRSRRWCGRTRRGRTPTNRCGRTKLSITIGGGGISADLRHWVNEGLMTFFFLVVGLEAKRELDMGELRERRRLAIPVFAALGGMTVPVAIYLAFNAGGPGAHGWGAAMSTDTAFALGALALLTPRGATRLRVFLLTLAVVDDLGALMVIAIVYTTHVSMLALAIAIGLFGAAGRAPLRRLPGGVQLSVAVGVGAVGRDVQVGHRPGHRRPRDRTGDERLSALARGSRAGHRAHALLPRAAHARAGALGAAGRALRDLAQRAAPVRPAPLDELRDRAAVRARQRRHPRDRWPARRQRSPRRSRSASSLGYVVGKPLGILGASWLASRPAPARAALAAELADARRRRGRRRHRLHGLAADLEPGLQRRASGGGQARRARLGARWRRSSRGWCSRVVRRLPAQSSGAPDRRHRRGHPRPLRRRRSRRATTSAAPDDALVTLLEYGDFECPYCGQAESVVRELLASFGDDVRYVWRHLPLNDVHPQRAARRRGLGGGRCAGQVLGDATTRCSPTRSALTPPDLAATPRSSGSTSSASGTSCAVTSHAPRVAEDVASADASGVSGTPTFFINGRRHYGAYDIDTLTVAVQSIRGRAGLLAKAAVA